MALEAQQVQVAGERQHRLKPVPHLVVALVLPELMLVELEVLALVSLVLAVVEVSQVVVLVVLVARVLLQIFLLTLLVAVEVAAVAEVPTPLRVILEVLELSAMLVQLGLQELERQVEQQVPPEVRELMVT